jgi:hypothetical protein
VQPVGHSPLIGEVVAFDEPRGVGVLGDGAGNRLDFHCTAIEDGSRNIEVGTVVTFTVRAGRLGRLEAGWIRPLAGQAAPWPMRDRSVQSGAGSIGAPSAPSTGSSGSSDSSS